MPIPEAAQEHYTTMQGLQALMIKAGERSWSRVSVTNISESWMRSMATLIPLLETAQRRAAFEGSAYSAATLAQQDDYTPPDAFVDVDGFAGYASDGRSLDTLLYQPAARSQTLIAGGMNPDLALESGLGALSRILSTQVADAGRAAGGVDVAAREGVGYVRMVRPGACSRCSILAGKWFRWNTGFRRHPRCSCVHVANRAGSTAGAVSEGLVKDPYEAFKGLPKAEQDRIYGEANAKAIRDGADINQVVNSRRGMSTNGNFTTEGTTMRGNAAKNLKPGQRRMTPELIYSQTNSRAEALELLEYHGYVLPGGQIPGGALRGQREGFGQLGGGGQRKGAVADINRARETGVRDPRNRNTMTAAERRLYDAEQDYRTALSGFSPYTSPGFGNTPDPHRTRANNVGATTRPVSQAELATAEKAYRRLLATSGQKFTR